MPALCLSILNDLKLIYRGFLEILLVRLCLGGSVLLVRRTGLVESPVDFTILLRFSMSLAGFLL